MHATCLLITFQLILHKFIGGCSAAHKCVSELRNANTITPEDSRNREEEEVRTEQEKGALVSSESARELVRNRKRSNTGRGQEEKHDGFSL